MTKLSWRQATLAAIAHPTKFLSGGFSLGFHTGHGARHAALEWESADLIDHDSAARLLLPIVDYLLAGVALGLLLSAFLDKDVVRDGIPL